MVKSVQFKLMAATSFAEIELYSSLVWNLKSFCVTENPNKQTIHSIQMRDQTQRNFFDDINKNDMI